MRQANFYEALHAMPDGARKKFYLVKHFGALVRERSGRDPHAMSCEELLGWIGGADYEAPEPTVCGFAVPADKAAQPSPRPYRKAPKTYI
jgi:hypothetical protein